MPLLYRILMRLVVAWIVGVGGLLLAIGVYNGTLAQANWQVIGVMVGAPAAIVAAIAWILKPANAKG